ncbi:MAG: site-specific integrase [Firmicutes bacterium]|nr:site-specific integrase [Bacillota bacterium]
MAEKRRDSRGRILQTGETQRSDGSYRYKTRVNGKEIYLTSWRLIRSDVTPKGKKDSLCLRDQIRELNWDIDEKIHFQGGGYTVFSLASKYCSQKVGVKKTTKVGYQTVLNILKKEKFSSMKIADVGMIEAKEFLIKLQRDDSRSFSSIHCVRGVLRPAFQSAVDDNLIRKNPFEFPLSEVLIDDSTRRQALTRKQMKQFLEFVKRDNHYSQYYEGMYILFHTGMRISEFCGLTHSDIDLKNRVVSVNRQLLYRGKNDMWVESTKSTSGERLLPIPAKDEELFRCFEHLYKKAKKRKSNPSVGKVKGFLYLSEAGLPMVGYQWSKKFTFAVSSYNRMYKEELPKITPHVCRHTYCSLMIKSGANPKTVQKLMGHASIEITMDLYTHMNIDDIKDDIDSLNYEEIF